MDYSLIVLFAIFCYTQGLTVHAPYQVSTLEKPIFCNLNQNIRLFIRLVRHILHSYTFYVIVFHLHIHIKTLN